MFVYNKICSNIEEVYFRFSHLEDNSPNLCSHQLPVGVRAWSLKLIGKATSLDYVK